jgi:hypothetical protein
VIDRVIDYLGLGQGLASECEDQRVGDQRSETQNFGYDCKTSECHLSPMLLSMQCTHAGDCDPPGAISIAWGLCTIRSSVS